MVALPRVVTVDPTGTIARIVRASIDLIDQSVIQIDVPGGPEALEEINRVGCHLVVTALQLTPEMHGIDFAMYVKQAHADTAVIVLSDINDPEELDPDFKPEAPFVYLHRPVDAAQFMRVLTAGLEGNDIFAASAPPVRRIETDNDMGPIPRLDVNVAERVIDSLLTDVGAMAIILASRGGEILTERGAVGYLNREQLTAALLPTVRATVEMGQLVGGGTPSALHFFDGDTYDVFVLSVGFHHFMCLVYDGSVGNRQFGAVNRFGRRAAEDLITLMGKSAFTFSAPAAEESQVRRRSKPKEEVAPVEEKVEPLIERAQEWVEQEKPPLPEPEPIRLDPIENFDMSLFDNKALDNIDLSAADDLFDPERLAEIANETRRDRGPLSYDEARELGIIP